MTIENSERRIKPLSVGRRDSGYDWFGATPSHWTIAPLYARYELCLGKMLDAKRITGNHLVPYLRNVDVQWDRINKDDLPEMDITADEYARFTLNSGDLIVCEGGEVGRAALWQGQLPLCGFQKALHRLRPRRKSRDEPRFLFYLLRHLADGGVFVALGNPNTIPHLTGEALRVYRFPFPSLDEQRAIAGFLDRETARIDELIAKKRRLVELLKEKRQALISRAVTKGLDPNAPLKPSGIDWLGEIPAHWDAVRLCFLCEITTGERDTQDAEDDGEYPFFVRSDTIERISTWSFDGEGVLTSGDGVGVGKVFHHYAGKMEIHQRVYLFHGFRRIAGRFLFHFLRENLYKVVLEGGAKSTVDSLRRPMLRNFAIAVPPLEEQERIIRSIDDEEKKLGMLEGKIGMAISRLKEFRSSLITAAVTGQIDVRGLVS